MSIKDKVSKQKFSNILAVPVTKAMKVALQRIADAGYYGNVSALVREDLEKLITQNPPQETDHE